MAIKHLLQAIVGWLDRKFPDQVVLTKEEYAILEKRLKYLENEVTKFNASLGFSGIQNTAMGGSGNVFTR